MKTLPDKVIIYDNNCPMCSLYTKGFVEWGLLEKQNRISFTDLHTTTHSCELDLNRARHEIPLIDLKGGKTIYGLDALLFVIGNKIPFINSVLRIKPIHTFSTCLYEIVSYNRRIIVPATIPSGQPDFAPDLSTRHRLYFVGITILLSGLILYAFGNSLNQHLNITGGGSLMVCIVATGWLLQMLAGVAFIKNKAIDYISHLAVIMLMGALVLVPGIVADALTGYQYTSFPLVGVILSSAMMLWQHFIRIAHLQLNQIWTLSWLLTLQFTAVFWIYMFYFNN